MTSKTRKPAAPKVVIVLARVYIKKNGHVVYICRGSKGEQYFTTVIAGKATGCTCKSYKPCKHMAHCQQLEAARPAAPTVEQAAQAGDKSYKQAVAEIADYDLLATTKDPVSQRFAYGSCSHLVKPEHEGDLCGACLSRLLFG